MPILKLIRSPLTGFIFMGLFWGAWGSSVPAIRTTIGATDAQLGIALLFVAVGAIPSMLLGGRLTDRLGFAIILPASIALFGLASVLPGLAATPWTLGASLLVIGMASGLMDVAMNAKVSAIEGESQRSLMQFAHGTFAVFYMIAALLAGQARGLGLGPDLILMLVLVLGLILAVLAVLWTDGGKPEQTTARRERPELFLVLLGFVAGIAFLAENGLQSWSALFVERLFLAEPQVSSLAPALVGLAVAVGRFGGQLVSSRVAETTVALAGSLLGALGAGLFALAPTLPLAMTGLFLSAAGASLVAPAMLGIAGRTAAPGRRGAAIGTVSVIAYSGFFLGPALLGFMSHGYGLRAAVLTISGGFVLAALLVLLVLARMRNMSNILIYGRRGGDHEPRTAEREHQGPR